MMRPFACDPGDARRFANDPSCRRPICISDPDCVQYRLKKAFDENWTAAGAKQ